jgi:hypothetical protein
MSWKRTGIFFEAERAQLPVISNFDDEFLVTFSSRDDKGRSLGNMITLHFNNDEPVWSNLEIGIIKPGKPGSTDASGCMPMQIIDKKLYYIGWTLRQDVPYFNYCSVAERIEGSIIKLGPILAPDIIDNSFSGTLCVIKNINLDCYMGYYLSADKWIEDELGALQPSYDIKISKSYDGLQWKKLGLVAIAREGLERGVSAASVIMHDGLFHMWFSSREAKKFRSGEGVYKIKHAYSYDGLTWYRSNNYGLEYNADIGENMCAYPTIVIKDDKIHMFYNGFSFGQGGIYHAHMCVNDLLI